MDVWKLYFFFLATGFILQNSAYYNETNEKNNVYSESNGVSILTKRNFYEKIYGQKHALLVQFYNSYNRHCMRFAPKFKDMAKDISAWQKTVQLAVLDCSENINICEEFEVVTYPSLRYLHENYVKGNANVGDRFQAADSSEKLKTQLIHKLWTEQATGSLLMAPPLSIASYVNYTSVLADIPNNVEYVFLVFENKNSTVGSELALDIHDYEHTRVKRVYDNSELVTVAGVTHFPALRVIKSTGVPIPLIIENSTKEGVLRVIKPFLNSKNKAYKEFTINSNKHSGGKDSVSSADLVYYSDLEKTINTSLYTEIIRNGNFSGKERNALLNYLDVLVKTFPFKANLKEYIVDLYKTLSTEHNWNGADVSVLIKRLETKHAPVYKTDMKYIGCKGSQAQYRGYFCGLWTLFHTLTVSAALKPDTEGPNVLRAMHGYINNFINCTDCTENFLVLARKNTLFDVEGNEKAILWLWAAHNEINSKLAGDITEDPDYPKIQYPSAAKCPKCRLANGDWSLPDVYSYLQSVYAVSNRRDHMEMTQYTWKEISNSIRKAKLNILLVSFLKSIMSLLDNIAFVIFAILYCYLSYKIAMHFEDITF